MSKTGSGDVDEIEQLKAIVAEMGFRNRQTAEDAFKFPDPFKYLSKFTKSKPKMKGIPSAAFM